MKRLRNHIKKTAAFESLKKALETKRTLTINETFDDVHFLLIALIQEITQKPILIVHHNLYHAQKMYDALSNTIESIAFFPQDEFITTEMLAMSEALKLERLSTIQRLINQENPIVITHPTGFVKNMMPLDAYRNAMKQVSVGDEIDIADLTKHLISLGYKRSGMVENIGEFAIRGNIVDIFPTDVEHPIRLDFFDTEIESIRHFNINTQRSIKKISAFTVFPRTEFFYDDPTLETIIQNVQAKITAFDMEDETQQRIEEELEKLRQHDALDELSRYMVFTGEPLETLSDYLKNPLIITIDRPRIDTSFNTIVNDLADWTLEMSDYPKLGFDFITDINHIYREQTIAINPLPDPTKKTNITVRAKETTRYNNDVHMLMRDLQKYDGHSTVWITLKNEKRLEYLKEAFKENVRMVLLGPKDEIVPNRINISVEENPLSFEWFDINLIVLNDQAIYQEVERKKPKYKSIFKDTKRLSEVKELKKGDYIVHYDYGIGRFLGFETMDIANYVNDYIVIQYKGDDTLYIPVENIHMLQKYVAHEGIHPRLNKLGGADWGRTKQRVRKKAKDIAEELIKLYTKREQVKGYAFSPDSDLNDTFEADFMYEETEDQLTAIEAVKHDMEKPRPMDRLLCGDVGYGKTEVALRASFKATLDNKQVAYLAPTTVLARQHYYLFKERLEKHGVHVALLNRFVTPARQKRVLEKLKSGAVDIVIGTHRLLSKDVIFKDLGLLIIDEEQRFGVEHKEKIKAMKLHVDVLSLSATPIPRTLQMAISGVKEMSLLETPPKNRFPVQTYVLPRNDHVIKDAIERELARKGQTFYLYNRVETIDNIQQHLSKLVPDARIVYAHGKMSRLELEKVITAFLDHQFDVLVSTTIIETGIDIPNANTLIIHDSDQLGLSQLYQIRGRVGRSDRIAYSYLMYQKNKRLTEEARKRLQVIKEFTELGSGYKIAIRDLAIRGAGDILGTEQSGFVDSVGIDMFLDILKEEIDKEKSLEVKEDHSKLQIRKGIKVAVDKTISSTYIQDDATRIDIHKRIGALESSNQLILLKDELEDRFGKLPKQLYIYMLEKLYENLAVRYGIEKVIDQDRTIHFIFSSEATKGINGERLFSHANDISPHITLAYKRERIHVTMEKYRMERHYLNGIVELLESL